MLSGAVAVAGHPGGEPVVRVHGERRFLGALDLFGDRRVVRTAVVVRGGEVPRLSVEQLRTLLAQDVELRELVQRSFLVRAGLGYELAPDLRVLAPTGSPDVEVLRAEADAHGLRVEVVELDAGPDADRVLAELDLPGVDLPGVDLPVVMTKTGWVLRRLSDADLQEGPAEPELTLAQLPERVRAAVYQK